MSVFDYLMKAKCCILCSQSHANGILLLCICDQEIKEKSIKWTVSNHNPPPPQSHTLSSLISLLTIDYVKTMYEERFILYFFSERFRVHRIKFKFLNESSYKVRAGISKRKIDLFWIYVYLQKVFYIWYHKIQSIEWIYGLGE